MKEFRSFTKEIVAEVSHTQSIIFVEVKKFPYNQAVWTLNGQTWHEPKATQKSRGALLCWIIES